MTDRHDAELVRNLRAWSQDSGYDVVMQGAANAIERLTAERDGALARLSLERVNHREEMDALRAVTPGVLH